jgi:hypothetical protein
VFVRVIVEVKPFVIVNSVDMTLLTEYLVMVTVFRLGMTCTVERAVE